MWKGAEGKGALGLGSLELLGMKSAMGWRGSWSGRLLQALLWKWDYSIPITPCFQCNPNWVGAGMDFCTTL